MSRSLLIIGTALVVAGAAPSFAQEWQADPSYGSTHLSSGFTPDPFLFELTAGGSIDVSNSLGGNCEGFVANAPDFNIYYDADDAYALAISVSSDADTTLVINAPDGRWYCDDDGSGGLNPAIIFGDPDAGPYNIWVGTYSNQMAPAALAISEINSR